MSFPLRPLRTVEILDAAWFLLRRHAPVCFAASAVGSLPIATLVIAYFLWLGTLVEGTDPAIFRDGTTLWSVAMALAWGWNALARGAVTAAAIDAMRGASPSVAGSWGRALGRAGPVLLAGWLGFIAATLGLALLVAPGLVAIAALWPARAAALDEKRGLLDALRRGRELTAGYRLRAVGLWALLLGVGLVAGVNLHLGVRFALATAATVFGVDTGGWASLARPGNPPYLLILAVVTWVLVEPFRAVVDALFYFDLRIRREGADLQERLRALRGLAAAAAALVFLVPIPARAMTADEYLARVRAARQVAAAASDSNEAEPALLRALQAGPVRLSASQTIDARTDWAQQALADWRQTGSRDALLRRLEAMERMLGGLAEEPGTPPPVPATATDVRATLDAIIASPEFRPLAARPELGELASRIDLRQPGSWWRAFWGWVRTNLFRPFQGRLPNLSLPGGSRPDVSLIALGVAVLAILVLFVRAWLDRAQPAEVVVAGTSSPQPGKTENALEHTADEWERFAQRSLEQGDLREAVRALYLGTLVQLHRQRRIDYRPALTNWSYVRAFRGEEAQRELFRRLTRAFDDAWYGRKPCRPEAFRELEACARTLCGQASAA